MAKKDNSKSILEQVSNYDGLISDIELGFSGVGGHINRQNIMSYMNNLNSTGDTELPDNVIDYLSGQDTVDSAMTANVFNIISKNLYGIEGMPYQFHPDIDRRILDNDGKKSTKMGRKFADRVFARMPLLFITPCRARFMDQFKDSDRQTLITALLGGVEDQEYGSLLEGKGKYYTPELAYKDYYSYLNIMLRSVAVFLGIGNETVTIGNERQKLNNASWENDLNPDFKTFFSAKENLVFYMDSFTEVSQSLSNSYGDSSLAATINGFAETANEIKFLFGTDGNAIANAIGGAKSLSDSILSGLAEGLGNLAGGIVQSVAADGISTILNGGKIIFPQVWQDSSMDESYSINFKFRSPDHDSLSIYLNVLKPYCKLLALAMAQQDPNNVNGYNSPFIIKAYSKGMFNVDLGAIASMNVTKGAECQWNDDGLPTQIDVSIDIQNLYSHLAMSGYSAFGDNILKNTAYMDFLCNMAGLNIAQMEMGRRLRMRMYYTTMGVRDIDNRIFNFFDNQISNAISRIWEL